MAIVGELGAGKTLSLTYLAYRNFLKGKKIYANYKLVFPYTPIKSVRDLENMQEGFFAVDELWLWVDSRASMTKKNRIVSRILLSSRKRGVHLAYTTQSFIQVDKKVRNVTDFIAKPILTPRQDYCYLYIYTNPSLQRIKVLKFPTAPYFKLYNTKEEVEELKFEEEEDETEQLKKSITRKVMKKRK